MQRSEIQEMIRTTIEETLSESDVPNDYRHRRRLLRALIRLSAGLAADLRVPYANFIALVIEQIRREAKSWEAVLRAAPGRDSTLN
jgi:hypothetical protein